jgi:hypothetical protein
MQGYLELQMITGLVQLCDKVCSGRLVRAELSPLGDSAAWWNRMARPKYGNDSRGLGTRDNVSPRGSAAFCDPNREYFDRLVGLDTPRGFLVSRIPIPGRSHRSKGFVAEMVSSPSSEAFVSTEFSLYRANGVLTETGLLRGNSFTERIHESSTRPEQHHIT